MKTIDEILSSNNLTENDFSKILTFIKIKNPQMANLALDTRGGWQNASPQLIERILEIYNNSKINYTTGEILELNVN